MGQGAAGHAGSASPSGAPQDFRSTHLGRIPKDSAFPGALAAGREDGGNDGRALLKLQEWSFPQPRGRRGSLTLTGSRVTAFCCSRCCSTRRLASASSSCASFSGSTSSWSAARYQTASFAGSDAGVWVVSGLGLARRHTITTSCVPRWLRPVHRQLGEGNEAFALRVQQLVAKELGQTGTRLTPADKAEHMKRQRHPRLRPQSAQSSFPPSPGPSPDMQLATLAQRVKEVLPHVPLGVIQRDLAKTGCVDLTITNLLEGAVAFMPEDITQGTQSLPTASASKFPSSGLVTPQPTVLTFAKSSWARQESLQERKQALYEYARRRFTERQAQEAD
ncbi:lipid droplet-regulating VLDL assembly factor AUP1 isoform X7 [Callithrix jacchus]